LRKKSGLGQSRLSEEIGVSEITLRRWENTNITPDGEALLKIANILNTSVSFIVGEGESETDQITGKFEALTILNNENDFPSASQKDMLYKYTKNGESLFLEILFYTQTSKEEKLEIVEQLLKKLSVINKRSSAMSQTEEVSIKCIKDGICVKASCIEYHENMYCRLKFNLPIEFNDMDPERRKLLLDWIYQNLNYCSSVNSKHTSYGMKHIYQSKTGNYVTNGEFKGAMLEAGFKMVPCSKTSINCHFSVSERSLAFRLRA
jgi:transcriptional regulator with XRE-family HTH domain